MVSDMICTLTDCNNKVQSRGLCSKHYTEARRNGSLAPLTDEQKREVAQRRGESNRRRGDNWEWPEEKACTRCGEVKNTVEEFYTRKDTSGRVKPYSHCKDCHKAYRPITEPKAPTPPKVCIIEDCETLSMARGMCTTHYNRWQKGREVEAPVIKKFSPVVEGEPDCRRCTLCEQKKSIESFYVASGQPKSNCKACCSMLSGIRAKINRDGNTIRARNIAGGLSGRLKEKAMAHIESREEDAK